MAKTPKSKKVTSINPEEQSSVTNIETQVESTVEVTQESSPVAEEAVVDQIVIEEPIPAPVVLVEEKIESAIEVPMDEVLIEKVEEPTPVVVVESIPTRKIGKFIVGGQFLTSNPTFFTWLHKQGYSIVQRTLLKNGNIEFVVEGGTLDAVSGDVPEYTLSIGNYLSLRRK